MVLQTSVVSPTDRNISTALTAIRRKEWASALFHARLAAGSRRLEIRDVLDFPRWEEFAICSEEYLVQRAENWLLKADPNPGFACAYLSELARRSHAV